MYPLGAQVLTGLVLELDVRRAGERLRFHLEAETAGVMWTWADLVTLADLDLEVGGYALTE